MATREEKSKEKNLLSQTSQSKPAGNTKNGWQLYRWLMTIPEEEYTASQLSQELEVWCKKWTFQKEKGESGYVHWQVAISLKTKEYFHTVKNIFGDKAHIEPLKGNAGFKYCEKDDTRLEGPYTESKKPLKLINVLREWQQKLVDQVLKEPDDRSIHWFYDPVGNAGKTVLAKWLVYHHKAMYFQNSSTKDIAFAMNDKCKIAIFDFTRSLEGHINYGALEMIKNGILFSGKYESSMKIMDPPHVLVFANFTPNYEALSKDRWVVTELSKLEEIDLEVESD